MRLICVAGTRPNFVKIKPVMDALEARGAEVILVHTGQHYDPAMSEVFFADLGIRRADHFLGAGSGTHAVQTSRVMTAFEPLARRAWPPTWWSWSATSTPRWPAPWSPPSSGSRWRTWRRACAAATGRCPRRSTGSSPTGSATTCSPRPPDAVANLRAEGCRPEQIHLVGNVMVDTLLANAERAAAGGDAGPARARGRDSTAW